MYFLDQSSISRGFNALKRGRIMKGNEKYHKGFKTGFKEGFEAGLKAHCHATSELTEEESELILKFLVRHNFVLCYDDDINGFRVRRNDKVEPRKPTVVCSVVQPKERQMFLIDSESNYVNRLEIIEESLVQHDLRKLDDEHFEKQQRINTGGR